MGKGSKPRQVKLAFGLLLASALLATLPSSLPLHPLLFCN